MPTSIADLFAAQIAELKEQDQKSQRKTKETLTRIKSLVAQLKALDSTVD